MPKNKNKKTKKVCVGRERIMYKSALLRLEYVCVCVCVCVCVISSLLLVSKPD